MIQIGGLQKLTLIDFPGRLAATVFLCGCNFRCPWCYSRELVLPGEIEKQPKISEKELFDFLQERKDLLEGVVVCGGEPTIHKELPEFIGKIKKMGYLVKLDTNGSNSKMLRELIGRDTKSIAKRDSLSSLTSLPRSGSSLIDYVAMDVKLPKERYKEVLRVDAENIEKSVKVLKNSGINYEFRTTVVPTVLDKNDIIEIAKWLSPAKRYYLQNFRPEKTIDPEFEKIRPYPDEYLSEIKKAISSFFEVCQIR